MEEILRQDISSVQNSIITLSVTAMVLLLLAILAHAGADLLPALYQRDAVTMSVTEMWLWVWVILLAIWARKLYQKM